VSTRDGACPLPQSSIRGLDMYRTAWLLIESSSSRTTCCRLANPTYSTRRRCSIVQTCGELFHRLPASFPPYFQAPSDSPNHHSPAPDPHRRPTGTNVRAADTTAVVAYPPSAAQTRLSLRSCRVRGWPSNITDSHVLLVIHSPGESSGIAGNSVGSRCSQPAETTGLVMPHHR